MEEAFAVCPERPRHKTTIYQTSIRHDTKYAASKLVYMYNLKILIMAVYIWGFGKLGQLGNGRTDTVHTPIKANLRDDVLSVHCGGYFTAVITASGQLFTFGCGKYGRLGTGDEADRHTPEHVHVLKDGKDVKLKKVSCGIWHGAAVSEDNDVFVWGYGKSHGVLGTRSAQHLALPTCLPGTLSNRVAGVSCGNNFSVVWTMDGEAFSWGCGRHGVLGHGNEDEQLTPKVIKKFQDDGVKVNFMSAGFAHSGAVTEAGVFMFGRGEDGALGQGQNNSKSQRVPTLVGGSETLGAVELSCSVGEKHGHTLFVNKEGQVYSFGDGYKGKLGLGDQNSRYTPTKIPEEHFNGEYISHVSAGGIHSAAVSRDGSVFTWGCGSDGRLGHPEGQGHRYLFRSDIPKLVEGLPKVRHAVAISCSYYHTAASVQS